MEKQANTVNDMIQQYNDTKVLLGDAGFLSTSKVDRSPYSESYAKEYPAVREAVALGILSVLDLEANEKTLKHAYDLLDSNTKF